MSRLKQPPVEIIHALYPELKELWMLVYEANCLERRLASIKNPSILGLKCVDEDRLTRLKEKNFDRYNRRLEIYLTTKKLMGVDNNDFLIGGGQAL